MSPQVQELLMTLWGTLVELDDLTASTNSIMMLLSAILSCPSVSMEAVGQAGSLTELVPRLWPFLRHSIKSVRSAVLKTLKILLVSRKDKDVCNWLTPILQNSLRHIYQRFILEPERDILKLVYEVKNSVKCTTGNRLFALRG